MKEFKKEVVRTLGTIEKGIDLRIVAWGNNPPKYDLRKWYMYNGEERCEKGISFNADVARQILQFINKDEPEGSITHGNTSLRVGRNKYGIDIAIYNGSFRVKGNSFSDNGIKKLRELLNAELESKGATNKVEAPKTEKPDEETYQSATINGLINLPANDCNYPSNPTEEELITAISYMEEHPQGNKTRLTKCKAKLKSLQKNKTQVDNVVTTETKETIEYSTAEEKLRASLEKYKDPDSEYVINGIIEACVVDDEFATKVLSPDKTYEGGFNYLYEEARKGKCIMLNKNVGIMDKDTALELMLEYFKN